jgi:hypothetical protein
MALNPPDYVVVEWPQYAVVSWNDPEGVVPPWVGLAVRPDGTNKAIVLAMRRLTQLIELIEQLEFHQELAWPENPDQVHLDTRVACHKGIEVLLGCYCHETGVLPEHASVKAMLAWNKARVEAQGGRID